MENIKNVVSIAGVDPTGGAGILADLKTFTAHKVYGMGVVTSIASQNTQGVRMVEVINNEIFKDQLYAISDDVKIDAVKIGMVPNINMVNIIKTWIDKNRIKNVVFDPVMVATSGHSLVNEKMVKSFYNLFSVSTLITPNVYEMEVLSKKKIESSDDLLISGVKFSAENKITVLAKGGDLDNSKSVDYLIFPNGEYHKFSSKKIITKNTHGTGCALSSSIGCNLSIYNGDLIKSVKLSKKWITYAISQTQNLQVGKTNKSKELIGNGPINHLCDLL